MPTIDERTAAALKRLRVEIDAKYGSVTALAPMMTTVKKHALLDNLNGTSMPKFNVVMEILDHLELSYDELMRRVDADLRSSAE
ncbi:hypothetical protein [Microbacterium jejuense]|uniref:hypothetical protein n=1 Tax=Microbacterium jejuense TaxID=1263637 RepID=UPI0031F1A5A3